MVVAGHQRDAGQAAGDQAAQERQPPGPVLAAGHVDAEDLPVPAGVHPGRDQAVHVHGPAALADLLRQRVDPHEGVRAAVQPAGAEPLHHLVELGRHRADLRLAQAGDAEGGGELLHPPPRDAQQVGRCDDRGQRPLRAAAVLQERREVRPVPQPRDRQLDGAGPGVPLPRPVAVARVHPRRAHLAIARAARRPRPRRPSSSGRTSGSSPAAGQGSPRSWSARTTRPERAQCQLRPLRSPSLHSRISKDHEVAASRHGNTPDEGKPSHRDQVLHTPHPWTLTTRTTRQRWGHPRG